MSLSLYENSNPSNSDLRNLVLPRIFVHFSSSIYSVNYQPAIHMSIYKWFSCTNDLFRKIWRYRNTLFLFLFKFRLHPISCFLIFYDSYFRCYIGVPLNRSEDIQLIYNISAVNNIKIELLRTKLSFTLRCQHMPNFKVTSIGASKIHI